MVFLGQANEIGLLIAIDGKVIEAGNFMMDDYNGVLVVPSAEAAIILAATQKKHAEEARRRDNSAKAVLAR